MRVLRRSLPDDRLSPIIWNANHDVYYTGGPEYLPVTADKDELEGKVKAAITPSIEQYTQRLREGEPGLDSWNLAQWIAYDIEHLVARTIAEITRKPTSEPTP